MLPEPLGRIERFLYAAADGSATGLPTPLDKIETYLYAIASGTTSGLPEPLSKIERYYYAIAAGDSSDLPEPLSRMERYLYAIAASEGTDDLPEPLTKIEQYLYELADSAVQWEWATETGAVVSVDDAVAGPVQELIADINPVQDGTGDPSPENVRTITGKTGAMIIVSPTSNPADGTIYLVSWQTAAGTVYSGTVNVTTGTLTVDRMMVTFDGDSANGDFTIYTFEDTGKRRIGWLPFNTIGKVGSKAFLSDQLKTLENYANSPDEWEVCNSGAVAARCFIGVPTSITSVAEWKTYITENPIQLVYELAEPVEYTLTPMEISTLAGDNVIWADTGDISVTYMKRI